MDGNLNGWRMKENGRKQMENDGEYLSRNSYDTHAIYLSLAGHLHDHVYGHVTCWSSSLLHVPPSSVAASSPPFTSLSLVFSSPVGSPSSSSRSPAPCGTACLPHSVWACANFKPSFGTNISKMWRTRYEFITEYK